MTKEERQQYNKDYRREGFGRVADRRYYERNKTRLKARALIRYYFSKPRRDVGMCSDAQQIQD